jgi:lia operon protein LiaG
MCIVRSTVLLSLLPAALTAQRQVSLTGDAVALYNLAGDITIVAGTGGSVRVDATPGGSDGGKLVFAERVVNGRNALVVQYPGDQVIYRRADWRGSTQLRVREDGSFGDDGKESARRARREVRITSSGSGLDAHADLRVSVPPGTTVDVFLGVGRIAATNVKGNLSLDAANGDVEATGITGKLEIDTGSGDVKVTGASGDEIRIDTGSGTVVGTGITTAELSVDTGSGDVTLGKVDAGRVSIDTGSGTVELDLTGTIKSLDVDTGSGGVTVRMPATVGAQLAIETGSGDIETDFPVSVLRTEDDQLVGTIGNGAGTINIDTGSGDVRLLKR